MTEHTHFFHLSCPKDRCLSYGLNKSATNVWNNEQAKHCLLDQCHGVCLNPISASHTVTDLIKEITPPFNHYTPTMVSCWYKKVKSQSNTMLTVSLPYGILNSLTYNNSLSNSLPIKLL